MGRRFLAQRLLDESEREILFLDVREPAELQADGWLPRSLHISMGEIPSRLGELASDEPIVVYCAHGMRSYEAGRFLMDNGFKDVASLSGGICAWTGPRERSVP